MRKGPKAKRQACNPVAQALFSSVSRRLATQRMHRENSEKLFTPCPEIQYLGHLEV